jgi:hypothetical protein
VASDGAVWEHAAESNLATVTTSRRLLIFRTPTTTWEIRLR